MTDEEKEAARLRSAEFRKANPELHSQRKRLSYAKNQQKNTALNMYNNAKSRAKRASMEFTLVVEDIRIPKRCPALGLELTPPDGSRSPTAPSLDRVDNSRGYTASNVVVISTRANTIKSYGTAEEHEAIARYIRAHQSGIESSSYPLTYAWVPEEP